MIVKYNKFIKKKLNEEFDNSDVPEGINVRAYRKIKAARLFLCSNNPFFSRITYDLIFQEAIDKKRIKTAATDGVRIIYNPDFILSLKSKQVEFLIAHEVMHCCLLHMTRRGNRNPKIWNYAADYAINLLLIDPIDKSRNVGEFIESGLYDKQFIDWSTEQIYEYLLKNPPKKQPKNDGQSGDGDGQSGDGYYEEVPGTGDDVMEKGEGKDLGKSIDKVEGDEGNEEVDIEKQRDKMSADELGRDWASKAKIAASSGGAMANRFFNYLKKTSNRTNWKSLLRSFFRTALDDNINYVWPPRRQMGREFKNYGSVDKANDYENVVLAIDISGSISQEALNNYATEIYNLNRQLQSDSPPSKICSVTVLYFHHEVVLNAIQRFNPNKKFSVDKMVPPKESGGTSFSVVFQWIKENMKGSKLPAFVIVFTDGYGDTTPDTLVKNYKNRILWVIDNTDDHPCITFGKKIIVTAKDYES